MRAADAYTIENLKVPSRELMQRAGRAIAEEVAKAADSLGVREITVVCGTGNNGGDGYVCARELTERGYYVKVYAFSGKLSDDCAREKSLYKGGYLQDICGAIVVDCIFGTGLSRNAEGEYADVIRKINGSGAYVISADIPSGICGDNGLVLGCAVRADITVAVAEYKVGMFLNDGLDYCGKVIKKDIGIFCPEAEYIKVNKDEFYPAYFPRRLRNTHKGTYGAVNIISGCEKYCGASVLNLQSALKSGCGFVKLTCGERLKYALVAKFPQVIYTEDLDLSADCILLGSGGGVSEELYGKILELLNGYRGKLVIDADGLNCLAKYGAGALKQKNCRVLVTPHIKEFSRLTGLSAEEIAENPVLHAQNFANAFGVTVALKSASTVVTDGTKTFLNVRGTTALSKAGSGDILAGFVAGTLAGGADMFEGACRAVQALGVSAEISSGEKTDYCATAQDIIKNLHFSVKHLTVQ